MGNMLNINPAAPRTEKGNLFYEFKRVPTQELQDCRIPAYSYLV